MHILSYIICLTFGTHINLLIFNTALDFFYLFYQNAFKTCVIRILIYGPPNDSHKNELI
jgi:hypothetical protein